MFNEYITNLCVLFTVMTVVSFYVEVLAKTYEAVKTRMNNVRLMNEGTARQQKDIVDRILGPDDKR